MSDIKKRLKKMMAVVLAFAMLAGLWNVSAGAVSAAGSEDNTSQETYEKMLNVKTQFKTEEKGYKNMFDELEASGIRIHNNGTYPNVFTTAKDKKGNLTFTFDTVNNKVNDTNRKSADDVIYYDFNNTGTARWDGLGWHADKLAPEGLNASDTFIYETNFCISEESAGRIWLTFRTPRYTTMPSNTMVNQSGVQFTPDGVYLRLLGASLTTPYTSDNYRDGNTHTLKIQSASDRVSVWIDDTLLFDNVDYDMDAVVAANDPNGQMTKSEDGTYVYRETYVYSNSTLYPVFGFYLNDVNVTISKPVLYRNMFSGLEGSKIKIHNNGGQEAYSTSISSNGNAAFALDTIHKIYAEAGDVIYYDFNDTGAARWDGLGWHADSLAPEGLSVSDTFVYETDFRLSSDSQFAFFTFRTPNYTVDATNHMVNQCGVCFARDGKVYLKLLGASLGEYDKNYKDGSVHTLKVESEWDSVSVWIDGTLIFKDVDYDFEAVAAANDEGNSMVKNEDGTYTYRGSYVYSAARMYPAFGFYFNAVDVEISNPAVYMYDNNTTAGYVARLIASVDKLEGYDSAGFILSTKNEDPGFGKGCKEITGITTVYSGLYENGRFKSASDIYGGDTDSQYVFAYDIGNLPKGTVIYARAYVKTSNGSINLGNVKTITVAGPVLKDAYVSSTGVDAVSCGSQDAPFATLEYAMEQVADHGTIHIADRYTANAGFVWKSHGKQFTITGGTLDFSARSRVNIHDSVIFTNMTLCLPNGGHVFANGNSIKIDSNVTVKNVALIYGAGDSGTTVESTDLTILTGTYDKIYGGGYEATVRNDTKVYIGGNVNAGVNAATHGYVYNLYGGSHNGTVGGNTYITVCNNAEFSGIYGGGRDSSKVGGKTSVKLKDSMAAYSVYGGSNLGSVGGTLIEMTGGTVYQVFGGNGGTSLTGNTDVRIMGGTIQRRIYGGCYNDYGFWDGWKTSYRVQGYSSVTIGKNANLAFASSEDDRGLFSTSRYNKALSGERGTIIFNDGTYSSLSGKIGSQDSLGSSVLGKNQKYNYLVKASAGGIVYAEGASIRIVPEEGYTATVTANGVSATFTNEDVYGLPTLSSDTATMTIDVVFSKQ